jgi:hypothetical protein
MPLPLLLLLLLPLASPAAGAVEAEERKAIVQKIQAVANEADGSLPPCLGHDRHSEAVLRHEPPRSCPKARAYYSQVVEFDMELRLNCRRLSRWAEASLNKFSRLSAAEARKMEAQEYLLRTHSALKADLKQKHSELQLQEPEKFSGQEGEFSREECAFAADLLLNFRLRQFALARKHYDVVNISLSGDSPADARAYSDFIRGGEEDYLRALRE